MSTASFKITDEKIIFNALKADLTKKVQASVGKIKQDVKPKISAIILKALNDSNTVQSLLSGKLKDDFGLFGNVVNVTMANITKTISDNIDINIVRSTKSDAILTTTLEILPAEDYAKIISVPGGSIPSKGGNVDWLEWLLLRGTQVVIGDFWLFTNAKGFTRSGGNSIMKRIESTPRDPFRVDPNYAGTVDDNFITRAIQSASNDILNALVVSVDRSIA
jgi:hypothetical protein